MTPHVHISPVHIAASVLGVFVVFGTLHLLALTKGDNRASRALIALGF